VIETPVEAIKEEGEAEKAKPVLSLPRVKARRAERHRVKRRGVGRGRRMTMRARRRTRRSLWRMQRRRLLTMTR